MSSPSATSATPASPFSDADADTAYAATKYAEMSAACFAASRRAADRINDYWLAHGHLAAARVGHHGEVISAIDVRRFVPKDLGKRPSRHSASGGAPRFGGASRSGKADLPPAAGERSEHRRGA